MPVKSELLKMQRALKNNLDTLNNQLNGTPCDKHYICIDSMKQEIRDKIENSLKQSISDTGDWFKAVSLIYSIRKANENVQKILETIAYNNGHE